MGFSSGGHLASVAALTPGVEEGEGGWSDVSSEVAAVCDWYGFTGRTDPSGRIHRLFHGDPEASPELLRLFDPVESAHRNAPPFLIMHGDADAAVPLECSRRLHQALETAGADSTLAVFEGAGHDLVRYDAYALMLDFFERHLRRKGEIEPSIYPL